MSEKDARDFRAYLFACTDRQVIGVLEKERAAGRADYAALAEAESDRRGLTQ